MCINDTVSFAKFECSIIEKIRSLKLSVRFYHGKHEIPQNHKKLEQRALSFSIWQHLGCLAV